MLAELRKSLYAVPLNQTLGLVPVVLAPGEVAIELPHRPSLLDHAGAMHTAALFAVGELAASVVLATHPGLRAVELRRVSTGIRYASPCYGDVIARTDLDADAIAAILDARDRDEEIVVAVRLHDAVDSDVALVESRFVVTSAPDR